MMWCRLFLNVILVLSIGHVAGNEDGSRCSYKAAALQMAPVPIEWTDDPREYDAWRAINLEALGVHIREAAELGADIVVLPEGTLRSGNWFVGNDTARREQMRQHFGNNVESVNGTCPCDNTSANFPLRRLSCAARKHSITVVSNMLGIVQNCNAAEHDDGYCNYNTNIVFNAQGVVVAVYFKQHLYTEAPLIDQAPSSGPSFFDLPLRCNKASVRIGLLICADLFFSTPWNGATLRKHNVKHLVISAWWDNNRPIYTAAMLMHGFAQAQNITLIAANTGTIKQNSGGIFHGKSILAQTQDDNRDIRQLVTAVIPVDSDISSKAEKLELESEERRGNHELQPLYRAANGSTKNEIKLGRRGPKRQALKQAGYRRALKEGSPHIARNLLRQRRDQPNDDTTPEIEYAHRLIRRKRSTVQKCGMGQYERIIGECNARGNESNATVYLKTKTPDGSIACEAKFTTKENLQNAYVLIATKTTVKPDDLSDPYDVAGCFLLPCVNSTDASGTIESCKEKDSTTNPYWPAHALFSEVKLHATMKTQGEVWPVAAGVEMLPGTDGLEDLVYPKVRSLEKEFTVTDSGEAKQYSVHVVDDKIAMVSVFALPQKTDS